MSYPHRQQSKGFMATRRHFARDQRKNVCRMKLVQEFKRLKRGREHALRKRAAMSVLGGSVIRVFNPETKEHLVKLLCTVPVKELASIKSDQKYRCWFEKQLSRVARCIKRTNADNRRIDPGYKWGHAGKVLNLYLRDIVHNSRYFSDSVVTRLGFWLYIPIDRILLRRLRELDCKTGLKAIKDIDTAKKYFRVQDILSPAAEKVGVPRVWFDDNWADRQ
jgi:hypothetical protein